MLTANVYGKRVVAKNGLIGKCPLCDKEVFPKCGRLNVDHWSHRKNESCQPSQWYEPETMWHYHWKKAFGDNHFEVVIEKEGKKHFADIFTNEEVVIELQNSPITVPVIEERELFYGDRMLWVINGFHFEDRFFIAKRGFYEDEYKKLPPRWLPFQWSNPRKCWGESDRPLFIDFKGEWIYLMHEGAGKNEGYVSRIRKEVFFQKYGGDYKYFKEHEDELYSVNQNTSDQSH